MRLQAARFSVVVPTLNESGNVAELVTRLARVLGGVQWEVIFVDDDSQDGTPGGVAGTGPAGWAGAGDSPHWAARIVQRGGGRSAGFVCALCGGDGCGFAARRIAVAADVSRAGILAKPSWWWPAATWRAAVWAIGAMRAAA